MPDARPTSAMHHQGQPARAGLGRVAGRIPDALAGRAPRLLQAALVLALLAQAGHLAWVLLAPLPATESTAPVPPRRALDPALAASAFGGSGATSAPGIDGLALLGLRRQADPALSTAILADGAGLQRVYGVGEDIRPGLRLQAVGADHVLLAGAGGTHRLALPAAVSALPVAPPAQKAPAEAPEPTGTAIDPRQLLAEAGLRPRLRNGRLDGFTLIQRGDGRTLRSAGLRSGDVLLAVNGEELTPERMAELGQMLQSGAVAGGATTLTLERDDQRHTITLQTESP